MTNVQTLEQKIYLIIEDKLGVEEKDIKLESSFREDLGADSLDTVELIMEFEKEFDVKIKDEEAEKVLTVGDAINLIRKSLN